MLLGGGVRNLVNVTYCDSRFAAVGTAYTAELQYNVQGVRRRRPPGGDLTRPRFRFDKEYDVRRSELRKREIGEKGTGQLRRDLFIRGEAHARSS